MNVSCKHIWPTLTILLTLIILMLSKDCCAQQLSATETINKYTIARKRLLVINTSEFINFFARTDLDQDSVMEMSCRLTSMPFLLPYQDAFPVGVVTTTANLINAGRVKEAKTAVELMSGDRRIMGLLEISMWYLHQIGTHQSDLDSASRFIVLAREESAISHRPRWIYECMFQSAELIYQNGNLLQSRTDFSRLASISEKNEVSEIAARAYMRIGDLSLTYIDKERFYDSSLKMYKVLGLKEKQIELLWKLSLCHELSDLSLAENDLLHILKIASEIDFKHVLYIQNRLSYILCIKENYLGGVAYARAAMDNLEWSGIHDVQGAFDTRMGITLEAIGKSGEAVQWLKKAIKTGTNKNHLFWYKSVLILAGVYMWDLNQPETALTMLDSVTSLFPPATAWEKLQVLSEFGLSYGLLGKREIADRYFRRLLDFARANKSADPFGSIEGDYYMISQLYIEWNNLEMARKFLQQSLIYKGKNSSMLSARYSLYYKMDSLQGNYKSALQNHIQYKLYYDSNTNINQRKKFDELNVQYATQKKDKDIELLKQQGIVQQTQLAQNKLVRNIMAVGTVLLLIIAGLLYNQYRLKKHTSDTISKKNLALQHLVTEKEWLLKEVHHRVKNNLHTIISLLESQAAYLENDALKAIETSQHRIYAMSLIHQKLYQSEDVKTIDMAVYLPEFIRYLEDSFGVNGQIQFVMDIHSIKLPPSQAIPVALIINEAVNNSIKYAFPKRLGGKIAITMHRTDESIYLTIADNGIGITQKAANNYSDSLGLKLMNGLSQDINGSMNMIVENGTIVRVQFPVDQLADYTISDSLLPNNAYA